MELQKVMFELTENERSIIPSVRHQMEPKWQVLSVIFKKKLARFG